MGEYCIIDVAYYSWEYGRERRLNLKKWLEENNIKYHFIYPVLGDLPAAIILNSDDAILYKLKFK